MKYSNISNEKDLKLLAHDYTELSDLITEVYTIIYIKLMSDITNLNNKKEYINFLSTVEKVHKFNSYYRKKILNLSKELYITDFELTDFIISIQNQSTSQNDKSSVVEKQGNTSKSDYIYIISKIERETNENSSIKINENINKKQLWLNKMQKVKENKELIYDLFINLLKEQNHLARANNFNNYYEYVYYHKNNLKKSEKIDSEINFLMQYMKTNVIDFLKNHSQGIKRPWGYDDTKHIIRISKPYKDIEYFVDKTISMLNKIDSEYANILLDIKTRGNLNLSESSNKAVSSFCLPLPISKSAVIFMDLRPTIKDINNFFHELGHGIHTYFMNTKNRLKPINIPPLFGEIVAMTFELLCFDNINELYNDDYEACLAKRELLLMALKNMLWIIIICDFEIWNYKNEEKNLKQRSEYFFSLYNQLNINEDLSGIEEDISLIWMRQQHIFEEPLYYLYYAKAQISAFSIYKLYKEDKNRTLDNFNKFMKCLEETQIEEILVKLGMENISYNKYVDENIKFIIDQINQIDEKIKENNYLGVSSGKCGFTTLR